MTTVGYQTILAAVGPVFLIIATGFGLRRLRWLSEEADASIMKIVVNLLYPCLILDVALGNPALQEPSNLIMPPLVGFGTIAAGLLAGYYVATLFGLREAARRTFAFNTGVYNYGFIPIPLITLLFAGSRTLGVLFVHNLGVEVAYWTIGIIMVTGAESRDLWKNIFNPAILAIILALGLNFSGLAPLTPGFIRTAVTMFGASSIPVGVLLSGAVLADHFHAINWRESWRTPLGACLLKMGLIPVAFLLLARFLPCSTELKRVIVVEAAMPAGIFPIIVARHYGGRADISVQVVFSTSALGLFIIPFWIAFGLQFAGVAP